MDKLFLRVPLAPVDSSGRYLWQPTVPRGPPGPGGGDRGQERHSVLGAVEPPSEDDQLRRIRHTLIHSYSHTHKHITSLRGHMQQGNGEDTTEGYVR